MVKFPLDKEVIEATLRLSEEVVSDPLLPIWKSVDPYIDDPFWMCFFATFYQQKGRTQPMYGPRVIQLPRDLADDEPLHELTVYKDAAGKTFATLTLELKADGEYATNPVEGLYPDGHPQHGAPSHVYIPGPTQPRLLIARSVPTLPQPSPDTAEALVPLDEEAMPSEEPVAEAESEQAPEGEEMPEEAEVPAETPAPKRRSTRG